MTNHNSGTYLLELHQIFENKGWNSKENYEMVFNSLSSLSDYVTDDKEEYSLILELLNRFHWISLNDYFNECRKLLIEIINDLEPRMFNIYTFPIIKKRHQFNVKSGSFVTYLIKAILPTIPEAKNLTFEDVNNYDSLSKMKFTKSDVVLLVDDFIGSGETFNECVKTINQIDKKIFERAAIFTIAIRKESLDFIKKNYKIYYALEILKGITDYNKPSDVENKKDVMRQIESKLYIGLKDYSLGYKESECLISLLRTPDNTFPIFWKTYKKRIKINPPFPRYEKA